MGGRFGCEVLGGGWKRRLYRSSGELGRGPLSWVGVIVRFNSELLRWPTRFEDMDGVVGCDAEGNSWRVEGQRVGRCEAAGLEGSGDESKSDVSESVKSSSDDVPSGFVEDENVSKFVVLGLV